MRTRVLGIILIFSGLSIIIYGLYIRYDTLRTQQKMIKQFEEALERTVEEEKNFSEETVQVNAQTNNMEQQEDQPDEPDNNGTANVEQQPAEPDTANDDLLKIEGINVIGIMEIPKIDLKSSNRRRNR